MWEKPTPLLMGFLVKSGRTHILTNTATPMWEITTTVGILTEQTTTLMCGALPVTLNICAKIAQFHFAFEFGLDQNEDECFTARHASIKKGNLPWSFTVCTAFKVEAWTKDFALYILSDDKGDDWHWLAILRSDRYTQFAF